MSANSFVIIPTVIFAVLVATMLLLRTLLRSDKRVDNVELYKYVPFESSNPPRGTGKSRLTFQYLGYLVMFLSVEPAVVLLTFLTVAPRSYSGDLLMLYLILVAVFAPTIAFGAYVAKRVHEWGWA